MGVTFFQALISLALEAYVFGQFQASLKSPPPGKPTAVPPPALTIPTYLALFIFGFIYELVLVWDALRLKNTIQVIGVCIYNAAMLIYAAVEFGQVDEAVKELLAKNQIEPDAWAELRPFVVAAPCVIALGTVLLSLLAWKLYDEFSWSIYKHISADLRLRRRYLTYQIYIALLKFDFFFFLAFTVQFLVVVTNTGKAEYALTIAAIPITVLVLFLAAYVTRRESYIGQICLIFFYFAGMAYFIFKLVRMYDSSKASDYTSARHSLTTFAVLTLILLVVTITTAIMCMRNFDKGLKPHIDPRGQLQDPSQLDLQATAHDPYNGTANPFGSPHVDRPVRMMIE